MYAMYLKENVKINWAILQKFCNSPPDKLIYFTFCVFEYNNDKRLQ